LQLQGFPEDFKQNVSKTQMFKQIGNSVLKELFKNYQKLFKKSLDKKQIYFI